MALRGKANRKISAGPINIIKRVMVSIVIPVLNEAAIIGEALGRLLHQTGDYEVLVVDGGSHDGTCEITQQFPVQLLRQPPSVSPGLGYQINRGAEKAVGNILMFLHIDVLLPPRAMEQIESALSNPRYIGGGFIPRYYGPISESTQQRLAVIERGWQTATRAFRWFAGDTAPFIRREVFWGSGGYPPGCFASDWDFAGKMQRLGPWRLAVIRDPALVHNRRLVQNGPVRTILVTASVAAMYGLGADRAFLRNWYRKQLSRER